ncbi:hypothetical protein ACQY0O_001102 [Thecaphora frezii]
MHPPPNNPLPQYYDGAVSQYLHPGQVPQLQQFGYRNLPYGYSEAVHPSDESVHGAGLLAHHDQDQKGQVHPLHYPEPPQHYGSAYQLHHGQVYGAGPSHLPDEIQGNVQTDFRPTPLRPKSEWFQGLRNEIPDEPYIRDNDPVRIAKFLDLHLHHGAQQHEREMRSALKAQLQWWSRDVQRLFSRECVSKLKKEKGSTLVFSANEEQRKIVFNIIMQRMLATTPSGTTEDVFVLKQVVKMGRTVTEWMRSAEEREKLSPESSSPFDESSSTHLILQWKSFSGVATFNLNEYRIVIGRKKDPVGNYWIYIVGGVRRQAPKETPFFLFLGNFAAPLSADFIGSKRKGT